MNIRRQQHPLVSLCAAVLLVAGLAVGIAGCGGSSRSDNPTDAIRSVTHSLLVAGEKFDVDTGKRVSCGELHDFFMSSEAHAAPGLGGGRIIDWSVNKITVDGNNATAEVTVTGEYKSDRTRSTTVSKYSYAKEDNTWKICYIELLRGS
ncbi:hypothetical protein [Nocardia sp. NPDC047654]|uniref:Rv0361 family membrane protein n=1 Tax=Nocardia sp. NPDC047654 TaxID=3364314 RepID=UPI003712F2BD